VIQVAPKVLEKVQVRPGQAAVRVMVAYGSGASAVINDGATAADQTWSSNKIAQQFGLTAPLVHTHSLKDVVDSSVKKSVRLATTANLAGTYDNATLRITANANGALAAIDGITPLVGDRLLVKNQTASSSNGIYDILDLGSAGSKWILQRSSDADTMPKLAGASVPVDVGTTNGGAAFSTRNKTTDTLGSTAVTWNTELDSSNGLVSAGNAIYSLTGVNSSQIRFWAQSTNSIGMSAAADATYGGRVAGATTSDYNI